MRENFNVRRLKSLKVLECFDWFRNFEVGIFGESKDRIHDDWNS